MSKWLAILFAFALAMATTWIVAAASPEDLYGDWIRYDETTGKCEENADSGIRVERKEWSISLGGDAFFIRLPIAPTCTARSCSVPTGWPAPAATWTWTFKSKDVASVEGLIRNADWPPGRYFHFKDTMKRGC